MSYNSMHSYSIIYYDYFFTTNTFGIVAIKFLCIICCLLVDNVKADMNS